MYIQHVYIQDDEKMGASTQGLANIKQWSSARVDFGTGQGLLRLAECAFLAGAEGLSHYYYDYLLMQWWLCRLEREKTSHLVGRNIQQCYLFPLSCHPHPTKFSAVSSNACKNLGRIFFVPKTLVNSTQQSIEFSRQEHTDLFDLIGCRTQTDILKNTVVAIVRSMGFAAHVTHT